MRVLLLSCLLGLGLAAPQGYFYQTQIGSGGVEGQSHISLEQYQIQRQQEQNQLEQQKLQLLHQQQIELQQQLQQQVQQQFQQQHYQQLQQQVQQQQQQIHQQVQQQQQRIQQQVEQQQIQQQVQQQQLQQGLPLQQQQQAFVVIGSPADLGQLVQFEQEQQLQQQQQQPPPESQQQAFVGSVVTRLGYETAVPEAQTQQQVFEVAASSGQLEQNSQSSLQQVVEQPPTSSLLSLSSSSSSSTSTLTPAQTIERPQTLPQVAHLQTSSSVATTSYQPAQTLQYHKEFYFLSAPQEDPSELEQSVQKQLGQMKKNLRVVFIKAPENNGLTKAALQLAQQSIDSQTAIYVLTKQHDVADLAAKLQQLRDSTGSSRPDVTFVNYRTPQEAEHAQRTIQAQFEALNGPNSFNYEGVAPTHNFVGSTDGSKGAIDLRSASASKPAPSAVVAPASSKATENSPAAQPSEEAKSPGARYLPAAKN